MTTAIIQECSRKLGQSSLDFPRLWFCRPAKPYLLALPSAGFSFPSYALGSTCARTNALFLLVCVLQVPMTSIMIKECKTEKKGKRLLSGLSMVSSTHPLSWHKMCQDGDVRLC